MKKTQLTEITAKQKLQSFFEGTAQAFNDWLYESDNLTCSCVTNGVKQAFADWLKDNHADVMNTLKAQIQENIK